MASFRSSRLGATRMSSLSTLQTPKRETTKRRTPMGLSRGNFLSWGLVYVTLYCAHALKPTKSLTTFRDLGNRDTRILPFPIQILETLEVSKVFLQREIDDGRPPLIQRYRSFRGFSTREIGVQQLQDSSSFKSPNFDMGSNAVVLPSMSAHRVVQSVHGPKHLRGFPITALAYDRYSFHNGKCMYFQVSEFRDS
jgi:hypothetical protein